MRMGFRILVVAVSIAMLSGAATTLVAPVAERSEAPPAVPVPGSSGTSPKFHVAEVFTGVWCGPCGTADPALSRIQDEWRQNLFLLAWHCCTTDTSSGYYDPYFDSTVTGLRDTYYNWAYLPTVVIDGGGAYSDGTLWRIGSGTTATNYDGYRLLLEDYMDTSSNVAVSVVGDLTPMTATASVSITATDPVTQTNLYLRTVVFEDALYWTQNNGVPYHRNTARALNEQPFTISQGQTITLTASFPLNPAWNVNNLGIVAFVQSNTKVTINIPSYGTYYNSDILNAAWTRFVPTGVLIHRDRGTVADYTEAYEVALANKGEHFDAWNYHALGTDTGAVDDRGLPDAAALDEASLLIWHTGPESMGVLSPSDRAAIGGFLDGRGSVLVTGASIGFDAWTTYRSWYQQYLHAAYESDDTGSTFVNGVAGDPISDAFSGTNLNVLASPDRINKITTDPNGFVTFNYPGPLPAGVRAQHDADSRVVYLGFQYFENTADANRFNVMQKIVDYMDGAAPPSVEVLYPAGGEQINPGANVNVRWLAKDVRFPANAVDVYFNSNYPSGPWTQIASNQPNDGLFKWTLPSVNSGSCRIRVVARDTSPESADGIAESASDFICGNPFFEITFGPGDVGTRRLISYPRLVPDTSVPTVLASLSGSYGVVRWWDPNDPADPWKAYYPTKGGGDLQYVDNTVGFWIEITGPGTLRISGTLPSSNTIIGLHQGWNLVGFPSMSTTYTVATLKAATGATRVEGYDAAAGPYYLQVLSDATPMEAGQGYWVYVPANAIWSVPPS